MTGTNNGESVRVIDRERFRLTLFHYTSSLAAPHRMRKLRRMIRTKKTNAPAKMIPESL